MTFSIAPTTVTKERAENMLFTEGYLNTDFQFLVKKDAPKIEKLEDFKGKIIAVNKGSAYDSWARGLADKIGWKIESFGTKTDAVQAVMSAVPMPMSPAIPRSRGRQRTIRSMNCRTSIQPVSCWRRRCERITPSCAGSSTSPSNA